MPRTPAVRSGTHRTRGFTLIELLIAISIFALVSSMAYTGLNNVLRARDRVEAEREFWRGLTLVFLRMQDDFAQARPRQARDQFGIAQPALVGQSTDIRATGAPSVEFTRGGVFVFELPPDKDADDADQNPPPPRSDLERIAYRYHDGILYRWSWPVLDRAPTTEPVETVMLRDVESFEVKFLNEQATSTLNQWFTSWPPPSTGGTPGTAELPRGVRVELKLKGRDEITRLFLING
jgi:general secretion pathway protein J